MDTSISLPPDLHSLIIAKVESGRYASSSDVVRAALHLLSQAEQIDAANIAGLRAAWREGIESGDAGMLDFADLRGAAARELARRGR